MRFVRFSIVGVINTIIDLGILNLLISIFGLANPFFFSIYKGISFLCAVTNSYYMNKFFTFRIQHTSHKTFAVFVFFSLMSFVINLFVSSITFYILGVYALNLPVHLSATIAGITGTLFGLSINYLSYSYFVFKQ